MSSIDGFRSREIIHSFVFVRYTVDYKKKKEDVIGTAFDHNVNQA